MRVGEAYLIILIRVVKGFFFPIIAEGGDCECLVRFAILDKNSYVSSNSVFPNPSSDYLPNENQDNEFAKRPRYVVEV